MPGGFERGCLLIAARFLPPWAELVDPSPVFEKRGARVCGRLISQTGPPSSRFRSFGREGRDLRLISPSPPFWHTGARLLTSWGACGSFLCWKRIVGVLFRLTALKVLLLLIVSISISFWTLLTSFEAADCRADSVLRIVVSFNCSGVVCGGGGVSSEGASRRIGFSGVISSNVSNRVRQ